MSIRIGCYFAVFDGANGGHTESQFIVRLSNMPRFPALHRGHAVDVLQWGMQAINGIIALIQREDIHLIDLCWSFFLLYVWNNNELF